MPAGLKASQYSFDLKPLLAPLLVSAGYLIGAEVAFSIGTLSDYFFAPFWPPNVVLFCALLCVPYRRWWVYLAAVFPVHVFVEWLVSMPLPQILAAFVTNCIVAMLNAYLVRRFIAGPPWLDSFHKAVVYIAIAACFSPAIVAFGGAFVRLAGGGPGQEYWTYWAQWYAANALASLTLGPVLLVLLEQRIGRSALPSRPKMLEGLVAAGALACVSGLAFKAGSWTPISCFHPAILYLPLPLVLWSAVRFGVKGASGAILIVTVVSIAMMLSGYTVFGSANSELNVLAIQLFLTSLAIPVLLLGAAIEGMQQAERTTHELAQTLLWSHDQERRRTAKELHEGICQELAAASLNAVHVAGLVPKGLKSNVRQLERMLQKAIRDLRATSYLLHPALLDESGLEPALASHVDTFSRDKDIRIDLAVSPNLGRLSPDIELAVFRIVQDALDAISSHAGVAAATIGIELQARGVAVTVAAADPAHGSDQMSLFRRNVPFERTRESVGLAGIRERLHRIGGRLELESINGQTVLKAIIRTGVETAKGSA